jgi:catechol 2,3-dioxygenase-like lactoylglutathione lyase family enzyme
VDRVVGLESVRAEFAMVETPDGHGQLELTKFHAPSGRGGDRHAPANTPGIRHVAFAVDDIDAVVASLRARGAELVGEVVCYEDSYRLCYVRGPEGIIVELADGARGRFGPLPKVSRRPGSQSSSQNEDAPP